MKSNINYVLVEASEETNDVIESNLIGPDGNHIKLYQYTAKNSVDTFHANRIYGTVISSPVKLDLPPLRQLHEGTPRSLKFCGHEQLKRLEKAILKPHRIQKAENYGTYHINTDEAEKIVSAKHCLGVGEYQYEYETEIVTRPSDKVYFHYLSICDSNFLGYVSKVDQYWKRKIYKVSYNDVYCVVRDGNIIMANKNVLVEPYYDEEYEEVQLPDKSVRAKINDSGLVTSVKSGPETLRGIADGRKVIFTPDSENKRTIEGKEYYVMKEWDIVAEFDPIVPVDPYVLIIPDKTTKRGLIHLNKEQVLNTGYVDKGEYAGQRVYFNNKSLETIALEQEGKLLVHKEDILALMCTTL